MKIYFACSISGGRGDAPLYSEMITFLKDFGTVLSEHFGSDKLLFSGENLSDKFIHDRDMGWILESDVVIAEVTTPSLGVGYEIGRSIEQGKKILCLYREKEGRRLSAMVAGSKDVVCKKYSTLDDVKIIVKEFLKK